MSQEERLTAADLREKINSLNEEAWLLQDQDPERSRLLCEQVQRWASGDVALRRRIRRQPPAALGVGVGSLQLRGGAFAGF